MDLNVSVPFLHAHDGQVQGFPDRLVVRELNLWLVCFFEAAFQDLDGIGGATDLSDLKQEVEAADELSSVIFPRRDGMAVSLFHSLSKCWKA